MQFLLALILISLSLQVLEQRKIFSGVDLVVLTVSILVFTTFFIRSQDIRNTVGNIPMEWYKDYPHIGYDLDGKKIFKPIRNKDELDEFLDKMENPDYW